MSIAPTSLVASTAASTVSLRIAAVSGVGTAAILFLNAAKRAELVPTTAATQLAAPFAQALGILFVVGLAHLASRGRPRLTAVATALNVLALTLLAGLETVINLVLVEVSDAQVDELLAGPLGTAATIGSLLFLVATLAYVGTLLAEGVAPRVPLVIYGIAAVPVSLRALVPEWALIGGVAGLGLGIGWLAVWSLRATDLRTAVGRP